MKSIISTSNLSPMPMQAPSHSGQVLVMTTVKYLEQCHQDLIWTSGTRLGMLHLVVVGQEILVGRFNSKVVGMVRFFRLKFTLEDAIEFHAFAPREASRCVTNGIPLGCSLFLPVASNQQLCR
jgi:hypothetical protein